MGPVNLNLQSLLRGACSVRVMWDSGTRSVLSPHQDLSNGDLCFWLPSCPGFLRVSSEEPFCPSLNPDTNASFC